MACCPLGGKVKTWRKKKERGKKTLLKSTNINTDACHDVQVYQELQSIFIQFIVLFGSLESEEESRSDVTYFRFSSLHPFDMSLFTYPFESDGDA